MGHESGIIFRIVTHHMSSETTHPPSRPTVNVCDMEYLSNYWTDLPQILNLSLGDQTKIENAWNEDDLQWKTTSKY